MGEQVARQLEVQAALTSPRGDEECWGSLNPGWGNYMVPLLPPHTCPCLSPLGREVWLRLKA